MVLGTLQNVAVKPGGNGEVPLIGGIASVIGQEGDQNGFYRSLLGKILSALAFLLAFTRKFAFSALSKNFVVPGSCPNSNTIALPSFSALDVLTQNIQPHDQTLQFSFAASDCVSSVDGLSLVYVSQQNTPIVRSITGAQNSGGVITF